ERYANPVTDSVDSSLRVFFFQAEDGIRDGHVTGVQTCALPILALTLTLSIMIARLMGGGARMAGGTAEKIGLIVTLIVAVLDLRSEERRVGKEWRSWWSL